VVLGNNRNQFSIPASALELNPAVNQGKESIILGMTNIHTGMDIGSALAHDYRARSYPLAPVGLNAQPLTVRVAPVLG